MDMCILRSAVGDSWAQSNLRNIGLRGLGFRMGGSVLIIEIATIYLVPAPHGALFDISNLTTTTLRSRYYYSNCTEEKTETQSN